MENIIINIINNLLDVINFKLYKSKNFIKLIKLNLEMFITKTKPDFSNKSKNIIEEINLKEGIELGKIKEKSKIFGLIMILKFQKKK